MAQVRPFADAAKTPEDSVPKAGLVQNVCKQWSVHEDEGLAHRLQKEEFQTHFGHNKEQRRVIRGDIKEAKIAYSEELTEAQKQHQRHLQRQRELEQRDQKVAENLNKKLLEEDARKLSQRKERDEELALRLQLAEEEQAKRITEELSQRRALAVGKSSAADTGEQFQRLRQRSSQDSSSSRPRTIPIQRLFSTPQSDFPTRIEEMSPSADEENRRRKQEIEDEKLARQLQEMEEKQATGYQDDYKLAVESQDAEYARVLEEKEKERLRKLQEKHRTKKAALEHSSGDRSVPGGNSSASDMSAYPARYHPTPPRFPEHSPPSTSLRTDADQLAQAFGDVNISRRPENNGMTNSPTIPNVATLIDPTYRPRNQPEAGQHRTETTGLLSRLPNLRQTVSAGGGIDGHWEVDEPAPAPYMPMNQLRQSTSLGSQGKSRNGRLGAEQGGDRYGKGKDKESCKTQ